MKDKINELEKLLEAHSQPDEKRVDLCNQLIEICLDAAPESVPGYIIDALEVSRNIDYFQGLARAQVLNGRFLMEQGRFEESEVVLKESFDISKLTNNDKGKADALKQLGNCCLYRGEFTTALTKYKDCIEISDQLGDQLGVGDLNTNSGIIFGHIGNYPQALRHHHEALYIYEGLNNSSRVSISLSNIGVIHTEQGDYEEALKTYKKALDISEKESNLAQKSQLFINIGNAQAQLKKFEEAERSFEIALDNKKSLKDKAGEAQVLYNLGALNNTRGSADLALDYYRKSLAIRSDLQDKLGMLECYVNMGESYHLTSKTILALVNLNKAIELSKELGAKFWLKTAYEHITKVHESLKDYEKAYEHLLKFNEVESELLNAQSSKQIAQITMRFEMEQKENEAEIERLKNVELKKLNDDLEAERHRSESLLLNILPAYVANELKTKGKSEPRHYDLVTVFFADMVNFTKISERLSPSELITMIDECFFMFDEIIERHNVEKIKLIGDAYMCAGGLPVPNATNPRDVVAAALEIQTFMADFGKQSELLGKPKIEVRIGIHSGPIIAGIAGMKKFAYDIWGDTVNLASRMETKAEAGRVNISADTYELVKDYFECSHRGKLEAKNKGLVDMYFVENRKKGIHW